MAAGTARTRPHRTPSARSPKHQRSDKNVKRSKVTIRTKAWKKRSPPAIRCRLLSPQNRVNSVLQLSIPWWEIVLRGSVVFFVMMLLLRLSGKRTVGQFTPFDLLVLVLLGDAMQGSMIAGDESLPGGIILAATLLGWNYVLGLATSRSRTIQRIVESEPVVLARNGRVYGEVLDANDLSMGDLQEAMRNAECVSFGDLRLAVREK